MNHLAARLDFWVYSVKKKKSRRGPTFHFGGLNEANYNVGNRCVHEYFPIVFCFSLPIHRNILCCVPHTRIVKAVSSMCFLLRTDVFRVAS